MATTEITIAGLATQIHKPVEIVLQAARVALNRKAVSPEYRLSPSHEKRIKEALSKPAAPAVAATTSTRSLSTDSGNISQRDFEGTLRKDSVPDFASLQFVDLDFRVFCHQDVYEGLQKWKDLGKKTTMAIRQIIAFGHTSVVKGCSDPENRGWLRSPLGGGSGNHYYLWWTRSGSPALKGTQSRQGDIVIRAIRHHDEHALLSAGNLDGDYLAIDRKELASGQSGFDRPWNDEQIQFIESEEPIRLANGKPGSGKTTVLWQAVDLRSDQAVLYATWSQKLVVEAEKHFRAFAPIGTQVLPFDFLALLGSLCEFDVQRMPLIQAFNEFQDLLPKDAKAGTLGPWQGKNYALFAEIRAHFIGSSIEEQKAAQSHSSTLPWNEGNYLVKASKRLSPTAAESVVRTVVEIQSSKPIASFFPELQASWTAIQRLRSGRLPSGFDRINRIVVDEVQDLTLLEQLVFVELCKAIGKASGVAPFLLLAGDEGQTVRPSGFEWSATSRQISERIQEPQKISLQESVRYPGRIAEVLENASKLYGNVTKAARPRKQSRVSATDYRQADVFHVTVGDSTAGRNVIQQLVEIDNLVVISALEDIDYAGSDPLQDGVLTPTQSKGLEYQSVCVVNPGRALLAIGQTPKGADGVLETLQRRTRIDQLRVAMSRATESLVFVDVEASEAAIEASRKLLDNPAPLEAADLVAHFKEPNRSPEERVLSRISDAQTLIETNPSRAWQLVLQALDTLGEPGLHNGVSDPEVRREAFEVSIAVAARILAEGIPQKLNRSDVCDVAKEALKRAGSEDELRTFSEFSDWVKVPEGSPFTFLQAITDETVESTWLRTGLSSKAQQLRKAIDDGSKNRTNAVHFDGDIERWLKACKFSGDEISEALNLRRAALDVLIENNNTQKAENVLRKIMPSDDPTDQLRIGKLRYIQSRWDDAATAFELGKDFDNAILSWRQAGKWENAQRVSATLNHQNIELEWLCNLTTLLKEKPGGLVNNLTVIERRRLGELKSSLNT
jgi:hypothetical protein